MDGIALALLAVLLVVLILTYQGVEEIGATPMHEIKSTYTDTGGVEHEIVTPQNPGEERAVWLERHRADLEDAYEEWPPQ